MTFEVTILGSNSALPAHGRHPTSQVVNVHNKLFLIDSGEGTQVQLNKYKVKHSRIEQVFISHLHGDHYFGLIGLITSYNLNHRSNPLTIYCPPGLEEIILTQLKHSNTTLGYALTFVTYTPKNNVLIFENDSLTVKTLELNHRVPCAGFVFQEKPADRNILKEKIEEFSIPVAEIPKIKKGRDLVLPGGGIIKNEQLTVAPSPPRSYAYCTDTVYLESIIPYIKEVDLLYHEATFDKSREDRAKVTFHCTTTQAATIAKKAAVKKLIIGHFSARYKSLHKLIKETQEVFPDSDLAYEGRCFEL